MPLVDERARAAYEAWHRDVQSDSAVADRPWHQLLFRYLRESDSASRTVLEIGCGRGELACHIIAVATPPARYVAADFADSAVRLGPNARGRSRQLRTRRCTGSLPTFNTFRPARTFDTVISCETVEHLPDPAQRIAASCIACLRPGGRLFLTTPNYMGPVGLYRGYLRLRGRRYTEGGQPICRLTSLPRTWLVAAPRRVSRAAQCDAIGHYVLRPGHVPYEPAGIARVERWLWPFGLHSLFVAEKPAAE